MSGLWAATAAFLLSAALCCRVMIISRYRVGSDVPGWLMPALFGLMLVFGGLALMATKDW
jgi:hypothetical protein